MVTLMIVGAEDDSDANGDVAQDVDVGDDDGF